MPPRVDGQGPRHRISRSCSSWHWAQVLERVRAEARRRDAGVLFLGAPPTAPGPRSLPHLHAPTLPAPRLAACTIKRARRRLHAEGRWRRWWVCPHAGDLWEKRYSVPFALLNRVMDAVQQFQREGVPLLMLVGNHDQVRPARCARCVRGPVRAPVLWCQRENARFVSVCACMVGCAWGLRGHLCGVRDQRLGGVRAVAGGAPPPQADLHGLQHGLRCLEGGVVHCFTHPTLWRGALWLPYRCGPPALVHRQPPACLPWLANGTGPGSRLCAALCVLCVGAGTARRCSRRASQRRSSGAACRPSWRTPTW